MTEWTVKACKQASGKNHYVHWISIGDRNVIGPKDLLNQIAREHNVLAKVKRIVNSAKRFDSDRLAGKKLFQLFPILDELAKEKP